jgi:hypothetical protein
MITWPACLADGARWPCRDGGGHLKKWVRARGSRTPSTSMSIFSL